MYIYIYFSEQITWNLYELVACQIMFVSYKIMIYIYIHIYNFRTNYMKSVWIGCMSGHFCIFKYHDVYIYIYIIFKPNDMKFVWIGCMSENLCMINNHNHDINIYIYISERLVTCRFFYFGYPWFVWFQSSEVPSLTRFPRCGGSFDFQGQLIKQNWHKYFSVLRTFRFSPILYVYRFLEIYWICLNDR